MNTSMFIPAIALAFLVGGVIAWFVIRWMNNAYKEAERGGAVYKGHLSELNN